MVQYTPSAQEIRDRKSYGQGSRARFDPQWAMSRPTNWYTQSYDTGKSKIRNTDLIKNTLVRRPAVTTDQNESRNMYQMLMNQIRGGGGAQLLDTSGIPAGARRTGRRLFTDPAKSQGFFGDVGSLFTGKNKAAVRAPVHNVFGNFGQKGKDFYKKEFPIQSGLNTLMEKAGSMMPYASWLKRLLPKRKKEIIPRNPMFSPENNPWGPAWELLEDEIVNDDFNWMDPFLENSQIPPQFNIQKLRDEGRSGFINPEDLIPTEVEEVLDDEITDNIDVEIKEKPDRDEEVIISEDSFIEPEDSFIESLDEGESFNKQYSFVNEMDDFDSPYDYIMELKGRFDNLDIDSIIQNAILNGIIVEKDLNTEMKNLNTQFDLILDQQAGELNKQEDIKREMEKLGLMYNI
jgi:hypothetical protein